MRLKKRFFACAILVILVSLLSQVTFAYFTTTAVAENVITSAGIDIELVEKTASGKDWEDVDGIMPGDVVSKIVTVVNKEADAYVRVLMDITVLDKDGKEMTVSDAQIEKMLYIDYDLQNWTKLGGAWYYNKALTAAETTKPLFTEVYFAPDGLSDEYQSCTVIITVQAQATQVANNGAGPLTAAGWPEN